MQIHILGLTCDSFFITNEHDSDSQEPPLQLLHWVTRKRYFRDQKRVTDPRRNKRDDAKRGSEFREWCGRRPSCFATGRNGVGLVYSPAARKAAVMLCSSFFGFLYTMQVNFGVCLRVAAHFWVILGYAGEI